MVKLAAEKRSLIIAMLRKFPCRSNAEIGRKLDVAASTVLSVKKKAESQINGEFYVQRLSKKSVIESVIIRSGIVLIVILSFLPAISINCIPLVI